MPGPNDGPDDSWQAQWIWQAEDGPANTWLCLRRAFDLAAVPTSLPTRIAADAKYWLWVNGAAVVHEGQLKRGPTPTGTWFDRLDLGPHLRPGRNLVAALVWYWGKPGFSHNDSGRGGFLFQADLTGAVVASDRSWRTKVHPAFATATAPPQPNYRLSESNVRFDARADLPAWTGVDFDDSAWSAATEKGQPPGAPWGRLWPRQVPQWRRSEVRQLLDAPRVADGSAISLPLPYNAQFTPVIEVEARAGAEIILTTDHYHGSGGKDNSYNIRSEYVCRDGRQQFESPAWMNGHALVVQAPAETRFSAIGWRESGFDCDFAGSFSCDDPFYEKLWRKAQRTLYITMRDTWFDCPDRERAQWWGDVAIDIGETFHGLDRRADALSRKAILDLVRWQKPNGVLYSPVPAGSCKTEIPVQSLASISRCGFWTYVLHSGDASIVDEAYAAMRRYLELWKIGADGLVGHRGKDGGPTNASEQIWDWGDWGEQVDAPLLDNAWYHLALDGAALFADACGRAEEAAAYRERMRGIAAAFDRHFWTGHGYRSPGFRQSTDDRGNALAVVAGIAPPERHAAIAAVLAASRNASPYMEKYVLEALFALGRIEQALERMRSRYTPMVESPLSTLWEFWNLDGTANHAWTGGPLTLLSQCVAGIEPTALGYATFRVRPQLGPLRTVRCEVPSPRGMITVAIERRGERLHLALTVPDGSSASVALPGGKPVATSASAGASATIVAEAGRPLVVGPGKWTIAG